MAPLASVRLGVMGSEEARPGAGEPFPPPSSLNPSIPNLTDLGSRTSAACPRPRPHKVEVLLGSEVLGHIGLGQRGQKNRFHVVMHANLLFLTFVLVLLLHTYLTAHCSDQFNSAAVAASLIQHSSSIESVV